MGKTKKKERQRTKNRRKTIRRIKNIRKEEKRMEKKRMEKNRNNMMSENTMSRNTMEYEKLVKYSCKNATAFFRDVDKLERIYQKFVDYYEKYPSPINPVLCEKWINSQHTNYRKECCRYLKDNLTYISFPEVIDILRKQLIKYVKTIGNKNIYILSEDLDKCMGNENRNMAQVGGSFIMFTVLSCYILINECGIQPDKIYIGNEFFKTNNTSFLICDDFSYSGSQMSQNLTSLLQNAIDNGFGYDFMNNLNVILIGATHNALEKITTLLCFDLLSIDKIEFNNHPRAGKIPYTRVYRPIIKYIQDKNYEGLKTYLNGKCDSEVIHSLINRGKYLNSLFNLNSAPNKRFDKFMNTRIPFGYKLFVEPQRIYNTLGSKLDSNDDYNRYSESDIIKGIAYFFKLGIMNVHGISMTEDAVTKNLPCNVYFDHKLADAPSTCANIVIQGPIIPVNYSPFKVRDIVKTIMERDTASKSKYAVKNNDIFNFGEPEESWKNIQSIYDQIKEIDVRTNSNTIANTIGKKSNFIITIDNCRKIYYDNLLCFYAFTNGYVKNIVGFNMFKENINNLTTTYPSIKQLEDYGFFVFEFIHTSEFIERKQDRCPVSVYKSSKFIFSKNNSNNNNNRYTLERSNKMKKN